MDNEKIFETRRNAYDKLKGARVGDYLKLPDGTYTRFTHNWGDNIQTGGNSGSFYLGDGFISYSGGLDDGVKTDSLEMTNETKPGWIWFFRNDEWRAHNSIHFLMDFRVFEVKGSI